MLSKYNELVEGEVVDLYIQGKGAQPDHKLYSIKKPKGGTNQIVKWEYDFPKPTEDELKALQRQLYLTEEAEKYKTHRMLAYPSIEDQLDTLYHEGMDAWKAEITAIKDKYPKTEGEK